MRMNWISVANPSHHQGFLRALLTPVYHTVMKCALFKNCAKK
jgi:hypothetical protein